MLDEVNGWGYQSCQYNQQVVADKAANIHNLPIELCNENIKKQQEEGTMNALTEILKNINPSKRELYLQNALNNIK